MDARKFAIGDQVRLLLDSYATDNPADVYTVSRTLPAMANVWQYRIKRVGDGQERMVSEQQLVKFVFQPSADRSAALQPSRTQAPWAAALSASPCVQGTTDRTAQPRRSFVPRPTGC